MTPIMQINWHDNRSQTILVVLDDMFVIIKRHDEFHGCKYIDEAS